jgi:hypothetical protein|tara:strand:+ start:1789 stop:2244 length:456 start_codon:yes stop_codon:yes gene_type:complete
LPLCHALQANYQLLLPKDRYQIVPYTNTRHKAPMHHALLAALLSSLLAACDIPYVAEGSWDVLYELPAREVNATWHIDEETGLRVEGMLVMTIDELELAGSRISWSAVAPSPLAPAGEPQRINFNGTVNGDHFAGTLYTRSGNLTVTGSRH